MLPSTLCSLITYIVLKLARNKQVVVQCLKGIKGKKAKRDQ